MTRAVAPPRRTYSFDSRMPRLPPVEKSPHARLRATLCPGVGYSVVTFDQSHSSSSAHICARPVNVPWPISLRAIRITTVSSGRMTTHALTSGAPSAARTTAGPNGMLSPRARPLPTAAEPMMIWRRRTLGWPASFAVVVFMAALLLGFGGGVDRVAHLLEGAATADVGHGSVNVGVAGL